MSLATLTNPVSLDDRYGGDQLNTHMLREFCIRTASNFITLANELEMHKLKFMDLQAQNNQLIKFMNWLAVTNPQILDEFQTTASAFDKLSPRNGGDEEQPHASPKSV